MVLKTKKFHVALCLAFKGRILFEVEAETSGSIATEMRGTNGFGLQGRQPLKTKTKKKKKKERGQKEKHGDKLKNRGDVDEKKKVKEAYGKGEEDRNLRKRLERKRNEESQPRRH